MNHENLMIRPNRAIREKSDLSENFRNREKSDKMDFGWICAFRKKSEKLTIPIVTLLKSSKILGLVDLPRAQFLHARQSHWP